MRVDTSVCEKFRKCGIVDVITSDLVIHNYPLSLPQSGLSAVQVVDCWLEMSAFERGKFHQTEKFD